jgi:hypothetical protein
MVCSNTTITKEAMYYKGKIDERSPNHCCRGNAKSITYSKFLDSCLSYPACNAHAPYYIMLCGLFGPSIFFHIISQTALFLEKSYWTQNVFWFSLKLLPETFLSLRTQRDITITVHRCSFKIPVILVWNLDFLERFFKILEYEISLKSVQWGPSCSTRTDGQTQQS